MKKNPTAEYGLVKKHNNTKVKTQGKKGVDLKDRKR